MVSLLLSALPGLLKIGDKFIEITPGGAEEMIGPGGKIRDTQSAIDFEELISNYVFGKL